MILIILSALAAAIGADPRIPQAIQEAIADIAASAAAVFSSGVTTQPSMATVLTALAGIITALKADPNLPQDMLDKIANLETLTQKALTADQEAQQVVDPSKIGPITPVA